MNCSGSLDAEQRVLIRIRFDTSRNGIHIKNSGA